MSARGPAKPRKPSGRGTGHSTGVKVAREEEKMKVDLEEMKENSGAWGIRIPSAFDPAPVVTLQTSVKKDEPSDDQGGVKHEDKQATNVKPEDTKQEHTKRETRPILSPSRLWEHGADGQRYIPRPTPVGNKLEDDVDLPDYVEQNDLPQEEQELPPPPLLQRQPSPSSQNRPSPSPQRHQSPNSLPPQPPAQRQRSPSHQHRLSPLPQPQQPRPQRQAQPLLRDGRVLPAVEVLLPRLKDVRRRQAARAAQPRQEQRPLGGPMRMDQLDLQNLFVIKPEPEDDVMPLVPLEEHDPAEAREVLRTAVENLRNPDVKVKKELILSDEFLLDALTWEGINHKYPVPLPKEAAEHPLPRNYISHLYGGSPQDVGPIPSKERQAWHGLADWIFLTLDLNPHAPTRPGHSGLFFKSYRAEGDWEKVRRTFIRVAPGKWVYMGQYKFEAGLSLTADAWKRQRHGVRRAWTKAILTKDFGAANCVEIWLRKQYGADYVIADEELNRWLHKLSHVRANLTEEDIIGAFDRGEQEMGTYRMTCVGYDVEFIQVLVRNVPKWIELEGEKQLEKQRRKTLEAGARAAQAVHAQEQPKDKSRGTGTKRKPIKIESDSEDEGVEEVKGGSDDSYEGIVPDLTPSSTGRPTRAAAMFKRQRTS